MKSFRRILVFIKECLPQQSKLIEDQVNMAFKNISYVIPLVWGLALSWTQTTFLLLRAGRFSADLLWTDCSCFWTHICGFNVSLRFKNSHPVGYTHKIKFLPHIPGIGVSSGDVSLPLHWNLRWNLLYISVHKIFTYEHK